MTNILSVNGGNGTVDKKRLFRYLNPTQVKVQRKNEEKIEKIVHFSKIAKTM